MIQQLRKSGNSFVVTIPRDVVEKNGWEEGQLLDIDATPLEVRPVLRAELREALDEEWDRVEPVLRYLADR
jgi:antitoxin component of MazEF toxin-antitoxin module